MRRDIAGMLALIAGGTVAVCAVIVVIGLVTRHTVDPAAAALLETALGALIGFVATYLGMTLNRRAQLSDDPTRTAPTQLR